MDSALVITNKINLLEPPKRTLISKVNDTEGLSKFDLSHSESMVVSNTSIDRSSLHKDVVHPIYSDITQIVTS